MKLCYVDESGKAETLTPADSKQQPVVVIGGISLPEEALTAVTHEWIELKSRFYPGLNSRGQKGWLDGILHDPKGASLRRGFRAKASKRQRKHAVGLIDGTLKLLERHGGEVLARIWLKELSAPNDDMKIHTSSLHFICSAFQAGLRDDERGMVVVDSQTYQHNFRLAHSMFTQRFGRQSAKQRLVDMPVFGHSDNHAGLQIADLLCSAVLAPVACSVYGGAYRAWNTHCDPCFLDIRENFGGRLERLTYEWHNARLGRDSASVVVHDPNTKRPTRLMWSPNSRRVRGPKQQSLKPPPKGKPRRRKRNRRKVASGSAS